MNRNWDNRDRYYDLNGNPLQGCIEFFIRGTNTKAVIYDADGVALANPQLTDQLGRTDHQVFINDDVTAYVYKYVGNGRFGNIEEESVDTSAYDLDQNDNPTQYLWALQYTVDSKMDATSIVSTDAAPAVMTMSALRALIPAEVPTTSRVKIVSLHGYYEAGDKEAVYYIWDSESDATDDNGSVIKANSQLHGRWILVQPAGFCDSRHFGVFPQISSGEFVDHTTGIGQLISYCNSKGISPLFNGSIEKPYFIYNFLTVSSRNPIVVSRGTQFVDKQHSQFYGEWDGDPKFVNALTKVSCSVIKASWNFEDAITYEKVYIDDTCPLATIRDADVVVSVPTSGKTFINCQIVSDGKLADNEFQNCVLRASMFTSESISPVIDDACTIQPLDFADRMDLWCYMRSQQSDPVIDVCMQTLDSSCDISLDGIFIKNALFNGFTHDATVSIGFECCRGSITLNALGNFAMTAEDSELTVTFTGTGEAGIGYQPAVVLRNSTCGFVNQLSYFSSFGAVGSEMSGNGILVNGDIAMDNCEVGIPMTVRGKYTARYCTIASNVLHYTVTSTAQVEMIHDTLKAYYTLTPSVAGTVVNAIWSNNYSTVDEPIVLERTNLDPIDSHHDYVYDGNSGGFIPYSTSITREYTIHHVTYGYNYATDPYTLFQTTLGSTASSGAFCWFGQLYPCYDLTSYFDKVKMFRVGIDRFRINARMTTVPSVLMNSGSSYEYAMSVPTEANLGAYWENGSTFAIRPWYDDPTAENLAWTGASPCILKGSRTFGGQEHPAPSFVDYHVNLEITFECMDKRLK